MGYGMLFQPCRGIITYELLPEELHLLMNLIAITA